MKLIFERGGDGRGCTLLPECSDAYKFPDDMCRKTDPALPQVSETEISRHYTELAKNSYGVNDGFYPLGSCTMKYNPKINEEIAALDGFTRVHPLEGDDGTQGCLEVMADMEKYLCRITGMDACTLQPAAGAHGEFTGLLMIKAWHLSRGDKKRKKIFVPDSAHGTNPASAAMAGFEIVNIVSDENGCIDIEHLRESAGDDTAGLMLTAPNTIGMFNSYIDEITGIIHEAGGLCYYDGANLNAIMGVVRPGDLGFDVMHINLHKTFSTPHGGGGPGSGPVACKAFLKDFLPGVRPVYDGEKYISARAPESIGNMRSFGSNFLVVVRAFCYILTLGKEGIPDAAHTAVLNANYLMHKLKDDYHIAFHRKCMHEFIITLESEKHELGITAMDVAKALLDRGIHPPTMYFPLIVHEALMVEPTETESRETLDEAAEIFKEVIKELKADPENADEYPKKTQVRRLDEVKAARKPKIRY